MTKQTSIERNLEETETTWTIENFFKKFHITHTDKIIFFILGGKSRTQQERTSKSIKRLLANKHIITGKKMSRRVGR